MTGVIVKIMVEALNILAVATKEIKQGCTSEPSMPPHCAIPLTLGSENHLKKLVEKVDIEGALRKLDKLTQEEVRMAIVQLMKINHGVDDKVKDISKGG